MDKSIYPIISTATRKPVPGSKIADLLAMPGVEEIELVIAPMHDIAQPADFS